MLYHNLQLHYWFAGAICIYFFLSGINHVVDLGKTKLPTFTEYLQDMFEVSIKLNMTEVFFLLSEA